MLELYNVYLTVDSGSRKLPQTVQNVFSNWELYLKYLISIEYRIDFTVRFCFIIILILWICDYLVFSIYLNSTVPTENYETGQYLNLKLRFCQVNCARSSWKTETEYLLVNGELPHVFLIVLTDLKKFSHSFTVIFKYVEVDVIYFDSIEWKV